MITAFPRLQVLPIHTIHTNAIIIHIDMRTNIEIDNHIMKQAMRSSGTRTKRATVEAALKLLIQTRRQTSIRRLRGKVKWEGNLERLRMGRDTE